MRRSRLGESRMPPAGIAIRSHKRKDGCATAFAYAGREKVGAIGACPLGDRLHISSVEVLESYRRQGIATALYEALARRACSDRLRLASYSWERNRLSSAFWDKQVAKGRAVVERDYTVLVDTCGVASLAGPRKR